MKNRTVRFIITMVLAVSTVIFTAGCGASANVNVSTSSKTTETAVSNEDGTYRSAQGWSVKYDPSVISVKEDGDATSFVYTGNGGSGDEKLTISYRQGINPEKTIDEIAAGWSGTVKSTQEVSKGESYFPGTTDKWGYWRTLLADNKTDISENAFAGEYNGGTLVFDTASRSGDPSANDGWKTLQAVMDSATYDNFAPQTMYEGMAGTYVMNGTEEIEGQEISYQYSVVLDPDHSGELKMQDDVSMMWGSHVIFGADYSYNYSINGNTLTLDQDGYELVFTKQ